MSLTSLRTRAWILLAVEAASLFIGATPHDPIERKAEPRAAASANGATLASGGGPAASSPHDCPVCRFLALTPALQRREEIEPLGTPVGSVAAVSATIPPVSAPSESRPRAPPERG